MECRIRTRWLNHRPVTATGCLPWEANHWPPRRPTARRRCRRRRRAPCSSSRRARPAVARAPRRTGTAAPLGVPRTALRLALPRRRRRRAEPDRRPTVVRCSATGRRPVVVETPFSVGLPQWRRMQNNTKKSAARCSTARLAPSHVKGSPVIILVNHTKKRRSHARTWEWGCRFLLTSAARN